MTDSDNDIDDQVDEILLKIDSAKVKPEAPEPAKKKRKPRGPPSEAQKKALAEGRRIRAQEAEIKRLEKEKKKGDSVKRLARLKKEKSARDDEPETDEIVSLKKQLDEMKQMMKQPNQPIINVHASAPIPIPKVVDPAKDALERQLRKYCKV